MEGDSNILDLVEPADRKGKNAQKIRARLGDLYHKHGGNKTQKRLPRAEDSEAMFWKRSRILSIERSMEGVPTKGKNSWDTVYQRIHLEPFRGQQELGSMNQRPCGGRLEILE